MPDKDMGFLPGGEKDKIKPFMQPLFDNLTVIKQAFKNTWNNSRLSKKIP